MSPPLVLKVTPVLEVGNRDVEMGNPGSPPAQPDDVDMAISPSPSSRHSTQRDDSQMRQQAQDIDVPMHSPSPAPAPNRFARLSFLTGPTPPRRWSAPKGTSEGPLSLIYSDEDQEDEDREDATPGGSKNRRDGSANEKARLPFVALNGRSPLAMAVTTRSGTGAGGSSDKPASTSNSSSPASASGKSSRRRSSGKHAPAVAKLMASRPPKEHFIATTRAPSINDQTDVSAAASNENVPQRSKGKQRESLAEEMARAECGVPRGAVKAHIPSVGGEKPEAEGSESDGEEEEEAADVSPDPEDQVERAEVASKVVLPTASSSRMSSGTPSQGDGVGGRIQSNFDRLPSSRGSRSRVTVVQHQPSPQVAGHLEDDNRPHLGPNVVEITSTDPRAAARAAAILKVHHRYIERGWTADGDRTAPQSSSFGAEFDRSVRKQVHRSETSTLGRRSKGSWETEVTMRSGVAENDDMLEGLLHDAEQKVTPLPRASSRSTERHLRQPTVEGSVQSARSSYRPDFVTWGKQDWRNLEKVLIRMRRAHVDEGGQDDVDPEEVAERMMQKCGLDVLDGEGDWDW